MGMAATAGSLLSNVGDYSHTTIIIIVKQNEC
jgi:hypothetical protein